MRALNDMQVLSRIIVAGIFAMTGALSLCARAESAAVEGVPKDRPLKVLMIGNSFSLSNFRQMPKAAAAMGRRLDLASIHIGGCSLERHWNNVLAASTNATFRPYKLDRDVEGRRTARDVMVNMPDALVLDKWDVVTIQQASSLSWRSETYQPFGDLLVAKIREFAPQAKIVVQETWSYPPWDKRLANFGFGPEEMYRRLHDAYGAFAKKHGFDVVPVGAAAERFPNRESLFTKPDFHFNRDGEYLQGLVFTAKLFGADVRKCAYKPDWMDASRAEEMKSVAMAAIEGQGRFMPVDFKSSQTNKHRSAEVVAFPGAPFEMPAIAVPQFAARDFSIVDFGAKEGVKATEAFAKAMAACEKAGGGRVVVPNGKWITGAVHFRNNCNLHLADDATLEFTDDPADYLPVVHTSWEGVECLNYSPLLYAYGVTNVAITGKGTIAPRMDFWKTWFTRPPEHMKATEMLYHWCSTNAVMSARDLTAIKGSNVRPHLIQFNRCANVLLDGFRINESPFWMIHLYHSESCVVRNLDTYAHGHNNDGVDIEMTRNVLVENCRFDQGDDGIVLKAGRNQDAWRLNRPTENVVVRNCEFVFAHTLLGIGSELSGGIRNVWMHHCKINSAFNLLYVKTNRRRGGFVKNVNFGDVECDNIRGALCRVETDVLYQWAKFPDYELRRTEIDGLHVKNIKANCADYAIDIRGDAAAPVHDVELENVWLGAFRKAFERVENAEGLQKRNVVLGDLKPKEWLQPIDEVWHRKGGN